MPVSTINGMHLAVSEIQKSGHILPEIKSPDRTAPDSKRFLPPVAAPSSCQQDPGMPKIAQLASSRRADNDSGNQAPTDIETRIGACRKKPRFP
jgi:hypothetical protein